MTESRTAAIELVYANLAALPHKEYGTINVLPFAHDSELVRKIKRQVCEAIVDLLNDNGYFKDKETQQLPVLHQLTVQCVDCAGELVSTTVDNGGISKVNAHTFIGLVSGINAACASGHAQITVDDVRQHIEKQFYADPETRRSTVCPICEAQPGDGCRKVKGHQTHNGLHDERGMPQ